MKLSKSTRVWFAAMAIILCTGIYLTGLSKVNFMLYLPAIGFVFAAVTGICLSQQAILNMFK